MSIVDFDCLKVTTMTVIVKMKGSAFIENAFPLLDITRLDLPPPIRPTKKYKIPYCGIPGALLSAKYRDITRGIVKSKTKRSFLNSITIDICTSKKNINAKLSGNIIQMCGPDSEGLARETAQHIIDHMLSLQQDLDYINKDPEAQNRVIQWLQDNTIGEDYIIDEETQDIIKLEEGEKIDDDNFIIKKDGTKRTKEKEIIFDRWHEGDIVSENQIICDKNKERYVLSLPKGIRQHAVLNVNFFINTDEADLKGNPIYLFLDRDGNQIKIITKPHIKVMRVKSITIPKEYPDNYPEDIDERVMNFYIKYAPDFAYHHVYCQFLDSVKNIDKVATDDLEIDSVNMAMINYSYSLGMSVDRWALANYINGRNGFNARYNNSTDHSVTIHLPYELPASARNVRRKNKPTRHTFMVHKSGIVTQSGPNINLMRDAYYDFMSTIMQIRDMIIQENKPFNLKFRPRYNNKELKIPKYQAVTC